MKHDTAQKDILSGEGAVVHEEKLDILGVVDKEGLVAGGRQVAGLLVATVTNLQTVNI
jgi:hypothetical protein